MNEPTANKLQRLSCLWLMLLLCLGACSSSEVPGAFTPDPRLQGSDDGEPPDSARQPPQESREPATPSSTDSVGESTTTESGEAAESAESTDRRDREGAPTLPGDSPAAAPQTPQDLPAIATAPSATFADLNTAPEPLRAYLKDVAALEILTPLAPQSRRFAPDKPIRRRTFARWLAAAHASFWQDRPEWQIRPVSAADAPVFADVPATDPDFATIQSLAAAGIIPSKLSGDDGPTNFAPDDSLTREALVAWKVPLDWRRGLPPATEEKVQEVWGFQDTDRIAAGNLAAVAADAASGDRANLRRILGYTQLLRPQQPVTRAEAAAALWFFGTDAETGRSAKQVLSQAESPQNGPPEATQEENSP